MFVTGAVPRFGGGGKPQRIIVSSRSPSGAVRTTGAIASGKTAGRLGRLPVRSRLTRNKPRMASWLRVMEYRFHIQRQHLASARWFRRFLSSYAAQEMRDGPLEASLQEPTSNRLKLLSSRAMGV